MPKKPKRAREPVMVYLDERDRALLERVVAKTGLARTELLRRGLRQVASVELDETPPGSAFEFLVETATDQDIPADLSARPDHYLYAGGYEQWFRDRKAPAPPKTRARIR